MKNTGVACVFLTLLGLAVGQCPNIVSRASWGARPPTGVVPINNPTTYAFVHHTAGGRCYNQADCSATVRGIQNYHMDSNGWADIGYSFLIGEDGNVYEGRGWMVQGAHTAGYNSVGHGYSVMGDFTSVLPNSAALAATQSIIACGVSQGHTVSNYLLQGHRDVGATACPGNMLYNEIQGWPNYPRKVVF